MRGNRSEPNRRRRRLSCVGQSETGSTHDGRARTRRARAPARHEHEHGTGTRGPASPGHVAASSSGLITAGALLFGVLPLQSLRSARPQRPTCVGVGVGSASCATSARTSPSRAAAGLGHARRVDRGVRLQHDSEQFVRRVEPEQRQGRNGPAGLVRQRGGFPGYPDDRAEPLGAVCLPTRVPTLTGYQATETVSATLRHLRRRAPLLMPWSTPPGRRADRLAHVLFRQPRSGTGQGPTAAFHQAVAHAQAMATAADRKLGAVCS